MMLITHLSLALLLGLLILRQGLPLINKYFFIALLLIGSILPDADCAGSIIGRKIKPISLFFKHRGFFHSLLFGVIIGITLFIITRNSYSTPCYALGFITGFLSHLFLDSLTRTGVCFFWPSKIRIRGSLRTNGLFDWLLFTLLLILILMNQCLA